MNEGTHSSVWTCGAWSHLDSNLWKVDLHGQLLPAVHVWIVGLLEGALQLVQLVGGEGGAVAAVLLLGRIVFAGRRRLSFVHLDALPQLCQLLITLVCKQARVCLEDEK